MLEASGGYERAVIDALQAAGQPVSITNPARVRHYAKARGLEAKTDALDAALISDFADWQQPAPAPVLSENQRALAELCTRRAQLLDYVTMEKNRQEHHRLPVVCQSGRTTLRQLERQLELIEQAIWELQKSDEELQAKAAHLSQVQGIGKLTAISLLGVLPELGQLSSRALASLAGLAPFAQESGQWKGQRHIRGGRAAVRRVLYMAALTATRYNPVLGPWYDGLRARGKAFKQALCGVMRRLLHVCNQLLKDPNFTLTPCAPKPRSPQAVPPPRTRGAGPARPRN